MTSLTTAEADVADVSHSAAYPEHVARRRVSVELDDELAERLTEIAEAEGADCSELLRRGAQAVIEAADNLAAQRADIESYRRQPQDPEVLQNALELASEVAPPW